MVDLTNIGTLFAFILVCNGIIVIRKRDPDRESGVPGAGRRAGRSDSTSFVLGLSLFTFSIPTKLIILGVAAVVFVLARNHIFPVLGIISCLYLIYYLPPTSWLRFAAWQFGFVIYAGYGVSIPSARARRQRGTGRPRRLHGAHRRHPRTGGDGAAAGDPGLDIVLVAFQAIRGPEGMGAVSRGHAGHIQSLDAWLQSSWFLTAPLVLNTFVLGPLSLRRAWRARQETADGADRSSSNLALGLSLLLLALGAAYLVAMLAHGFA